MKKNVKRVLSVILAIALLLTSVPLAFAADVKAETPETAAEITGVDGYYEYRVLEDGTAEIIGCNRYNADVVIPSELGGYKVTRISDQAFYWYNSRNFYVDSNNDYFTSVGGVLFNKEMTELIKYNTLCERNEYTIPASVTSIYAAAFMDAEKLFKITFLNNAVTIGESAFNDLNNLKYVTFEDDKTNTTSYEMNIGEYAFTGCRSLESIKIPNGVTSIGDRTFHSCYELKNVEIPRSVASIGLEAFYSCPSLQKIIVDPANNSYTVSDGILFNKDKTELILCPRLNPSLPKNYTVPNTVRTICTGAFFEETYGNSLLESVIIPNSVTTIEERAFSSCGNLTRVTIGNGVTSIGKSAFSGCVSLTNVTIPNSVTIIDEYAFCCCYFTSITIGSSVTNIRTSAFEYCVNLKDIYYASSEADWNKIQIDGNNFALLNADIHYNCSTGSDNIMASGYCGSTTKWKLYDNGTLTIDGEGIVKHYSKTYPAPWSKYASQIKKVIVGEGVTRIGEFAFYNCTNLTSAEFADSVEKISGYAFKNCSSLTDIKLPANLKNIGDSAFYGTALKEITMPESVEIIGHYAFSRCYSLKNIKFTGNAPTILSNSFSKVTATVKIPSDNATWTNRVKLDYGGKLKWLEAGIVDTGYCGSEAVWKLSETGILTISPIAGFGFVKNYNSASSTPWYKYASDIKTIIIEDGITRIGSFALYGLKNLSKIQFADTVKEINNYAFKKCSSLTEIKFPANIEKIGESAFYGTGVEQVVFPESIKEIHSYAFANCENLHEIEFTAIDPPKFGTNVFKNVVATIDIPVLTAKSWQQIIFQQKTILGEYLTFI